MTKRTEKRQQDRLIMNSVICGFRLKGTSYHQYCEENNLDRRNTTRALLGTWKGKKAKAIRSQIIQASNAKKLMTIQQ
jgi:hypothetical protein